MLLFVCLLFRLFFFNTWPRCFAYPFVRFNIETRSCFVCCKNSDDQISVVTVTTLLITY